MLIYVIVHKIPYQTFGFNYLKKKFGSQPNIRETDISYLTGHALRVATGATRSTEKGFSYIWQPQIYSYKALLLNSFKTG